MKKAVIVIGSPKTNGNTARLVKAMLSEIANSECITKIELSKFKKINHCTGCDSCKKNVEHNCIFDDGLNEIGKQVREADVLIIASPIYFFSLNSLTKAFIDRLFYSSEINNDENILKGKKIGILITYGLNNVMDSGAKNALQNIYDISRFVGLEIIGMVEGSFGEDNEKNEMLENKAKAFGRMLYKELL